MRTQTLNERHEYLMGLLDGDLISIERRYVDIVRSRICRSRELCLGLCVI